MRELFLEFYRKANLDYFLLGSSDECLRYNRYWSSFNGKEALFGSWIGTTDVTFSKPPVFEVKLLSETEDELEIKFAKILPDSRLGGYSLSSVPDRVFLFTLNDEKMFGTLMQCRWYDSSARLYGFAAPLDNKEHFLKYMFEPMGSAVSMPANSSLLRNNSLPYNWISYGDYSSSKQLRVGYYPEAVYFNAPNCTPLQINYHYLINISSTNPGYLIPFYYVKLKD